ncbi:hypothetical protein DelCs14_1792 [Delftia sp. Cs1-4]|nr:hypothetical protein DelCs14_1792 [Delftia sp. Cs1-4]
MVRIARPGCLAAQGRLRHGLRRPRCAALRTWVDRKDALRSRGVRPGELSPEFSVVGHFFRHERQHVSWRRLSDGGIGIVTILHERIHQIDRFREDLGLDHPGSDLSRWSSAGIAARPSIVLAGVAWEAQCSSTVHKPCPSAT